MHHDHDEDHDPAVAFDDLAALDRRRALTLLGGAALTLLVAGCGGDDRSSAPSTTAGTASGTAAGATTTAPTGAGGCTVIPEETAGPFPADGSNGPNVLDQSGIVRQDIRSSFGSSTTTADGVPLTIQIALVDSTSGCGDLGGAAVYVWHCDRAGNYSLYSPGAAHENYLRGVQETGADGVARFTSIFPACYSGRWPHIHFEVYRSVAEATSGGPRIATSQIAIPADAAKAVYATTGYEQSVRTLSQVTLTSDSVFRDDGGVHEIGTVTGSVTEGYTIGLRVPVDPTNA
jgi:protocatechuate 3,4-dioxygenase beta subunit